MRVYRRRLLALDDAELEHFARDWVGLKKNLYFEVKSYSGPQDLGRDVVGFLTKQRHEGPWHNYQCKQYTRRRLPLGNGLAELGKILYHAHTGEFTPPAAYHFVAPHGISRELEGLIDKPQSLRRALIGGWDTYCRKSIIQGKAIPLDPALRAVIEAYDFSLVTHISLEEMLAADGVLLVLHRHLGTDPGPAPKTPAPERCKRPNSATLRSFSVPTARETESPTTGMRTSPATSTMANISGGSASGSSTPTGSSGSTVTTRRRRRFPRSKMRSITVSLKPAISITLTLFIGTMRSCRRPASLF
jgi:hypothetical protein